MILRFFPKHIIICDIFRMSTPFLRFLSIFFEKKVFNMKIKENSSEISQRIKDLCKENDITASALEDELGFSRGYISKIGDSAQSVNVVKIAVRFGVSTDYILLGKEHEGVSVTADYSDYYENFKKRLVQYISLSEKQKGEVDNFIDYVDNKTK